MVGYSAVAGSEGLELEANGCAVTSTLTRQCKADSHDTDGVRARDLWGERPGAYSLDHKCGKDSVSVLIKYMIF